MSQSPTDACRALMNELPSCSTDPSSRLDVYTWGRIFENIALDVSLRKALQLKTLHSEAFKAVDRALANITELKVELREGVPGDSSSPVFTVQGTKTKKSSTAVELVRHTLSHSKTISTVDLYFEDRDLSLLNLILDEIIAAKNVKLENLLVKRRQGGQSVPKLGELIRQNASTLKKVARVGLTEAVAGLDQQTNLEHLALMTFDLGYEPEPNKIPQLMYTIARSGARFRHLSFTSFVGFDPTDETVQDLLDNGGVTSMKLTMMKGPKIQPRPAYMIGKVRNVKSVDLVEVVEHPSRTNRLAVYRQAFEKVFPNAVDNINIRQQWN